MLLFSNLNKIFFGYFDPDFFNKIIQIHIFRDELSDISARKEALEMTDASGKKRNTCSHQQMGYSARVWVLEVVLHALAQVLCVF